MDIPEFVVECLEEVRSGGACNMFDRACVLHELSNQNTLESAKAYLWLVGNDGAQRRATPAQVERYVAALDAVGTRRATV